MTAQRARPVIDVGHVLAHPAWIGALLLLLINDHVLKGAGLLPGWVTGKLSDLAGLFVAPALLAALVRARTRGGLLLVHVGVGVGFTALELSSELTAAGKTLYGAVGLPFEQWSDPTDLLALFTLPLAHAFARRVASRARRGPRGPVARALTAAGLLACAASTSTQHVGPEDAPESPDCGDADAPYPCEGLLTEDTCDNGWDDDLDGDVDCEDSDCLPACDALVEACATAAQVPAIDVAAVAEIEGSTLGRSSLTESNCMGADAPDDLILIEVRVPGTLVLELPPDHGVSVRESCADWRSEVACEDVGPSDEIVLDRAGVYALVVEALDPLLAADFTIPIVEFRPAPGRAP